jgi:hypothetical protein
MYPGAERMKTESARRVQSRFTAWAGSRATEIRKFMEENKDRLKAKE